MGEHLGFGAHMAELIRTKAGPFKEDDTLVTLHDLADAYVFWKEDGDESYLRKCIQPLESAVAHLPHIQVLDSTVNSITQGATLKVKGVATVASNIQVGELVAIMTLKGELVAVAEAKMISKDIATKERGVAVKSTQVFMSPGTYPKM
jgi:H/ACA ribonucleoprotein complex subunit 4